MPDFAEFKQRSAVMWSAGAFELVAPTIHDMHEALVHVLGPRPGERWLDLGSGAGSVAELAAGAGASVLGIDLSPRLVEVARERAAAGGYDIEYRVGDAEHLVGVDDLRFDVVVSSVGMIFAPDHEAVAREVARVLRPGGRLAFSAWTKEGSVGEAFRALSSFQPPPPPGALPPLAWGDEQHVRDLLAADFELRFETRLSRWEDESPEQMWETFSTTFGPVVVLLAMLDDARRAELERTMLGLARARMQPDGRVVDDREYLLVTGIRR